MASISKDRGGGRRIQFINGHKLRKTIRLGEMPLAAAHEFKRYVEVLNWAIVTKCTPEAKTALWLNELDPVLHEKLVPVGLADARQQSVKATIGGFFDFYLEKRADLKPNTRRNLLQVDHWLESHAKIHRRTWPEDKRQFDKHLAHLRGRRLSSISKSEVQSLHAKLGKDSGHTTANRILALIRAFYNKADSIGYRGANPAEKVRKFPETSRDRFLQPEELPKFWAALEQELPLFKDFFLIALLTGARRRNVQAMRWADVHLAGAASRIPHTKNDEPVLIHLPAKAVEILRRRHGDNGNSEWVFPTRSASGHLEEPKTAWKRIIKRAGLSDIRMHDLRRTLGSWQAIAGTSLPIIGRSLGHKSMQATQVYSRLTMAPVIESVVSRTTAILAAAQPPKKSRKAAINGKAK